MSRSSIPTDQELEKYELEIRKYWWRFCMLGMRPEFEKFREKHGVKSDGSDLTLVIKSRKLDPDFVMFKEFCADPKRSLKKSDIDRDYEDSLIEPAPMINLRPIPHKNKVIEWEECIRVYESNSKNLSAASEVWGETSLKFEKKAERRRKAAVKYIKQALIGKFNL